MNRLPMLLLVGLAGAASLSGCATKEYVDKQILMVNTRIDTVDFYAVGAANAAQAANSAAQGAANAAQAANAAAQAAARVAQAAASDAQRANSRVDTVTTRVDTIEQKVNNPPPAPTRGRRPRG